MTQNQEETEDELLDFDRAMLDFRAMFPGVSPEQIELVLRKYDGDVSATINELLFDNNAAAVAAPTSSSNFRPGEDQLTILRRRRHEINEKLLENQRLLDKVTDVESARMYEDQQLAYLLEHREVSSLIKEEKTKISHVPSSRKHVEISETRKKNEIQKPKRSVSEKLTITRRRSMNSEERVPDGPYVGPEGGTNDLAAKIKGTFMKVSGSRLSRLFSTP